MTKFWIVMALVLVPSLATAQTHPCDAAPVTNPTVVVSGPVSLGFCVPSVDVLGDPTTLTSFRVQVDSVDVFTGPLTPIGQPSTTGLNYYETPKTLVIKNGNHTAVVFASNAPGVEGAGSAPFAFTVRVPPGKGKVQTVVK
jgi:hypothetical protein